MNSAPAHSLADTLRPGAAAPPSANSPPSLLTAWPVAIAGVAFDPLTTTVALARIDEMIATRRPHHVALVTPRLLARAHDNAELHRCLLDADLVLSASAPLSWLSRRFGHTLPRVALPSALLHSAAKKARRVFLLGGTTREITDGVAALKQREPALNVVGIGTPPGANWLDRENEKVIHAVRAAQPDILLVSLATPSMESWLTLHYRTLGVPVTISFETRLDALVDGSDERSFRAAGRDAKDFLSLLPALLASDWRGNAAPEQPLRPQEVSFALPEWCHIDTGAQLTRVTLERDAAFWQEVFRRPKHCLLNAVSLRHVDATGLALLLRWRQLLLASGRQLVLLAPSPVLRHALATTRLSALFAFATDLADAARQAEKLGQSIVQRDGTTRSLAWCGEIIAANMDDVWRMTTDHILAFVANNATLVIVDLARLRFIDSAGASLMLRLKKWAQRVRVEIFFAHVQTDVRGVLRLTCIDQLLLEGGQ